MDGPVVGVFPVPKASRGPGSSGDGFATYEVLFRSADTYKLALQRPFLFEGQQVPIFAADSPSLLDVVKIRFTPSVKSASPLAIQQTLQAVFTDVHALKDEELHAPQVLAIHKQLTPLASGVRGAAGQMWTGLMFAYVRVPALADCATYDEKCELLGTFVPVKATLGKDMFAIRHSYKEKEYCAHEGFCAGHRIEHCPEVTCVGCGGRGHMVRECPQSPPNPSPQQVPPAPPVKPAAMVSSAPPQQPAAPLQEAPWSVPATEGRRKTSSRPAPVSPQISNKFAMLANDADAEAGDQHGSPQKKHKASTAPVTSAPTFASASAATPPAPPLYPAATDWATYDADIGPPPAEWLNDFETQEWFKQAEADKLRKIQEIEAETERIRGAEDATMTN